VHAAAGGVGLILCQWASHKGAEVIGTVGSPEKAELARSKGCKHIILYRQQGFVAAVREITNGRGVEVAYDSVGKDTFDGSLECLAMLGHLVNFGQSSGPVAPFAVSRLSARSTSVTRPMLFHYTADTKERDTMAAELFAAMADGSVTIDTPAAFALSDAAVAHRALEERRTSGSVILVP
jgi:NADPH2:quinone reductase